jgi:hypothetical protein
MNAVLVGNFDLTEKNVTVEVPHAGNWYDYYAGGEALNAAGTTMSVTLKPGAFKVLTDVLLTDNIVLSTEERLDDNAVEVYPNPSKGEFVVKLKEGKITSVNILDLRGVPQRFTTDKETVNASQLAAGLYILKVTDQRGRIATKKLVRNGTVRIHIGKSCGFFRSFFLSVHRSGLRYSLEMTGESVGFTLSVFIALRTCEYFSTMISGDFHNVPAYADLHRTSVYVSLIFF